MKKDVDLYLHIDMQIFIYTMYTECVCTATEIPRSIYYELVTNHGVGMVCKVGVDMLLFSLCRFVKITVLQYYNFKIEQLLSVKQ